jgi:carboxyl-terminal processing protease
MEKRVVPFRTIFASALLGIAIGGAATLVSLRAIGVPLQSGLATPAFQKFYAAYTDLHDKYYKSISDQTLLNGAIAGMTNSVGDPFTDYFPPTDATQFHSMLSGSYVGIGVEIQSLNGQVVIQSVMKSSPAQTAGLHAQDVIVKVNGQSMAGLTMDQVSSHVMGPKGSKVTITVKRPSASGSLLDFTVTRADVARATVFSKMLDSTTGYLQISIVAENTAAEVDTNFKQLKQQGAKRLIIDLRGNPGGYLDQAVKIAADFIAKGKVVVKTQNRDGSEDTVKSDGPGTNMPITVIMDQDTASAAEILAAALHDDNGVPLVGTKSYGKGTVQETQSFTDGSALKYTVAKWLTPAGAWIHGKGILPTDAVALPSFVALPTLNESKLPLRVGQNSTDVQDLQKMLNALGYSVDRTDGYFDEVTAQRINQFDKDNGLPVTGQVDKATADKLQTALNQLISKSDTQLQEAQRVARNLPLPPGSQ